MSYPTDASGDSGTQTLLALSPLLAMATSVVNAVGLAIVAIAALITTGVVMVPIRNRIAEATRWPTSMLAVGLCSTTIMLLLQAFAFDLYQRIALLVPIVITNWFVLARLDRAPHPVSFAVSGAIAAAALLVVGAACEAIGRGTLLASMDALAPADLQIRLADSGFLLAALPPGAFIIAGFLLAARQAWVQRA